MTGMLDEAGLPVTPTEDSSRSRDAAGHLAATNRSDRSRLVNVASTSARQTSSQKRTGAHGGKLSAVDGRTAKRSTWWPAIAGRWRSSAATSPAMSPASTSASPRTSRMLDSLEDVTTPAARRPGAGRRIPPTRRASSPSRRASKLDQGRGAIEDTIQVFSVLTDLVVQLGRADGRLRRGDEPGPEGLLEHRDDRQQDQHARPQRHDRGGARGRGGPLASRSSPPR